MISVDSIEGTLEGTGRKFGIVAARFNGRLVEGLVAGALDCFVRHGVAREDLTLVRVPGAFELPFALDRLAERGGFDGLIALGVVIRGETPHFDYVCAQASAGIARVSHERQLPIGFGLLTTDDPSQAAERCGGKAGNKGWDAALATLEMASLAARLASGKPAP